MSMQDNNTVKELHMIDGKAMLGTVTTAGVGVGGWLDVAEPVITIVMTLIVGAATLWYTVERAMKLRKERTKNDTSKESDGQTDSDGDDGRSMGDRHR